MNRRTCITYEVVRDLKGYTKKYKREDWNSEERYFSSYLAVLSKLIAFYKQSNEFSVCSDQFQTEKAIDHLDVVAKRSLKNSNTILSINPVMEKDLIQITCGKDVAQFNRAMLYCVRRMGYITVDDENMAEQNKPLSNMKTWFARRKDSLKYKSKVGCDQYSITHAVERVNNFLQDSIYTSGKQLNLEDYLPTKHSTPGH